MFDIADKKAIDFLADKFLEMHYALKKEKVDIQEAQNVWDEIVAASIAIICKSTTVS